jgi:hypothetical protein
LRAFSVIMAVVLGLVAGVFAILLFWFATASIYSSSPAVTIFWEKHDNIFAVYDRSLRIWCFVLWAIKRWEGQVNSAFLFILVFLAVLPLPSILGLIWWMIGCSGQHGGECGLG